MVLSKPITTGAIRTVKELMVQFQFTAECTEEGSFETSSARVLVTGALRAAKDIAKSFDRYKDDETHSYSLSSKVYRTGALRSVKELTRRFEEDGNDNEQCEEPVSRTLVSKLIQFFEHPRTNRALDRPRPIQLGLTYSQRVQLKARFASALGSWKNREATYDT